MNKKILGFVLFLTPMLSFAEQRLLVKEGMQLKSSISKNALNRIAVKEDRIISVKGNMHEFLLDKDVDLGQIFIKPLIDNKPIHIFISTEKGNTYGLRLMTEEKDAESILLVPIDNTVVHWEKDNSYEEKIKALIKAMHNRVDVEGYMVGDASIKFPKIQGATLKSLKTYMNGRLIGIVCEVNNESNEEIYIPELEFNLIGIRAVSVLNKVLPPKAKTLVYLVRDLS